MTRFLAKRGRSTIYEMRFVTPASSLDFNEARAVDFVLAKIDQGETSLCVICDHSFLAVREHPASIMICQPFAVSGGQTIVGGVCSLCQTRGFAFVKNACIAQFASTPGCSAREIEGGRA
jgi:hypothetical protein